MQALHVLPQEGSQAGSDSHPHPLSSGGGGGNDKFIYYVLYSLPVFSLAKSLQLILEIRATYKLVSYLLAD